MDDMNQDQYLHIRQLLTSHPPDRLLTVKEAARYLGVSARTIYRMVGDGQLRTLKIRGCTRLRQSTVTALVDDLVPDSQPVS
jgi:excisionase family DNA binding protein